MLVISCEAEGLLHGTYGNSLEDQSTYHLVIVGDLYTPADETAPVITIISPEEGHEYDSENVPLEWSIEEPDLMDSWYSMDHGSVIYRVAQSGDTILEMENGANCITLYAEDHSGKDHKTLSKFRNTHRKRNKFSKFEPCLHPCYRINGWFSRELTF